MTGLLSYWNETIECRVAARIIISFSLFQFYVDNINWDETDIKVSLEGTEKILKYKSPTMYLHTAHIILFLWLEVSNMFT